MAVKSYAVCLHNNFGADFTGADLMPGLAYPCLGAEHGMLRVVDESGEDYLYPSSAFHVLSDEESRVLGQSLARLAA